MTKMSGAPLGKAFSFSPLAGDENGEITAAAEPVAPSHHGSDRSNPFAYKEPSGAPSITGGGGGLTEREPINVNSPLPPPPTSMSRRPANVDQAARVARQQAMFENRVREIANQEARNNGFLFLVAGAAVAGVLVYMYYKQKPGVSVSNAAKTIASLK